MARLYEHVCGKKIQLPPDKLGKSLKCPACEGVFTVEPEVLQMSCTECGRAQTFREDRPLKKDTCQYCGGLLSTEPTGATPLEPPGPPVPPEISEGIERLTADADKPPSVDDQPPKFRVGMFLCLGIAAAFTGICFLVEEGFLVLTIFGAIISWITWMVMFGNDIAIPSPRGRQTEKKALNCFLRGIRYRHWKKAFTSVSPIGRKRSKGMVEGFPNVNAFRAYWKSQLKADPGRTKVLRGFTTEIDESDGRTAEVHVVMKSESYSNWIWLGLLAGLIVILVLYLVTRKEHREEFDILLLKHNSQWWVLTGEMGSDLEFAMLNT